MRPRRGQLLLADLSPGRGTEAGKLRPVVVLQSDLLNEADHPSTWVLPCTSRLSGDSVLRVVLKAGVAGNTEDCEVMIDQSRAIDNQRFRRELGMVPTERMGRIASLLLALGCLDEAEVAGVDGRR